MKTITTLTIIFGFTNAFGQAMANPSQSLQFREYAVNAEPLAHKTETVDGTTASVMQDFEKLSTASENGPYQNPSIAEITSLLDERISKSEKSTDMQTVDYKENTSGLQLVLYPNPSNTRVSVQSSFEGEKAVNLRIYQLNGQLVENILSGALVKGPMSYTIDVSNYAAGRYTVFLQAGDLVRSEAFIVSQ